MRPDTKAHPNGASAEDVCSAPDVEVKIASSWEELIGLIGPWTDLVRAAGSSGFSRPEFCVPYWSEAARGPAWVAQAWRGDDLLAVAPMWATSVGPVSVLNPTGTGAATRAGVLCRPGHPDAVQRIIDSAVGSCTGLLVEQDGTSDVAPRTPARHLRSTSTVSLDTGAVARGARSTVLCAGPAAIDDADAYDAGHQRTDWFVPGARAPLALTLVRTVVDTALRSGVAVVIRDGWHGASIWLAGTTDAELWCASGSCRPGAGQWSASVAAAGRWATERGLGGVRLPAAGGTADALPGACVERRDIWVMSSSARRLWAATTAARRLESSRQEASS